MEEVAQEIPVDYNEVPIEVITSDKDYILNSLKYQIKGLSGLIKIYSGKPNFEQVKPVLRSEIAEILLGLQQTLESL